MLSGFFMGKTMDIQIVLIALGITQTIVLAGVAKVYREVRKGNKDQQEIKTRLAWIKKRQLAASVKPVTKKK